FTRDGRLNISNAKWRGDFSPIDAETNSDASQNYTRAYLAHLFNSREILGLTLATMHNVAFYEALVRTARENIIAGTFEEWRGEFVRRYTATSNPAALP